MTINAQHWVWNKARSTGNPRLVLLAVADKVTGPECVTRMGTTELRARLGNVSKSVVVRAVDKALESGELVMVEEARGSRAAAYLLPFAAGYVRPAPGSTGPDSVPLADSYRSRIGTPSESEGYRIETPSSDATGPESGPGGYRIETPTGPESVPLHQTTPTRSEGLPEQPATAAADGPVPAFARDLVDTISRAGYDTLRWGNVRSDEWLVIHALIKSHGVDRLARFAVEQCQQRQITYGRYFIPGWKDLAPAPAPDPDGVHRLPVRRAVPAPASSPAAARRNAARDYLDELSAQLRAAGGNP